MEILGPSEFVESAKSEYYGEKLDEHNMKQYVKNFKNNYDNQIELEKKLGSRKEAKEFIKSKAADEYISNGITDIEDMAAGWKMEKQGIKQKDGTIKKIDRNMSIAGIKYGKRLDKKPKDMKQKDRDEWHSTIANELGNHKAFNSTNMDKDKKADEVFDLVNAYYDYKK